MTEFIYSFTCFIVPNVLWQLLNKKKLSKKIYQTRHIIWTYIFMLYCYIAVHDVAGIGTIWDFISYREIRGTINVIPFSSEYMVTYVLNIIMFMPLGFLLPLIWENFRNVGKVALTGLAFSISIEFCQLFSLRVTDIDDLIMNTSGAVAGYIIWIIFHKIFKNSGQKAIMYCAAEPLIYIAMGISGIFFLYNWRLLY